MELRLNGTVEPVWGDHDRLEQVFVNLLENAATHGASDGGIEVTLRHGPNHPLVEVEVRDHGPGIPPVLGERIFEPRVRGTIERAGAGLGLPIARAIVEAHGGTLASVPVDDGASFLVALPAEPPDAAHTLDGSWNVFDEGSEREVHDRVV
jgi:signal transduction histidine kinase